MDQAVEHPDDLAARAKAEKYAKILAKTIIKPGWGQRQLWAERLLCASVSGTAGRNRIARACYGYRL